MNSTIKPKIGTCTNCGGKDRKLIGKLCYEGPVYCYQEFSKKRYQEKHKNDKPKERKPIAKVSKKRAKELSKYENEKHAYLQRNAVCQFPGCDSTFVTLHHAAGRTGSKLYDPLLFRSLCWPHHEYCELNPEEAKKLNLSGSRLETA